MKYLPTLIAAITISASVQADELSDAAEYFTKNAVTFEVLADLSNACKIEIQVRGKDGVFEKDCTELTAFSRENKYVILGNPTENLVKNGEIDVISENPEFVKTLRDMATLTNNMKYIAARVGL